MRRLTIIPIAFLTLGLGAAACGGDDDSGGNGNGSGGTGGSASGGSSAGGSSAGGSSAGGSSAGGSSAGGSSAGGSSAGGSSAGGSSAGGSSAGGSAGAGGAGGAGEMTMFDVTIENLEPNLPLRQSGVFTTPEDGDGPAPIGPGQSYVVHFAAAPGDKLSFNTMFGQSNDLFLAPDGDGIELFDGDDMPISGDVTDQVFVWDAGTEVNQPLGEGPDQAPRQAAADTGDPDTDTDVRMVGESEYDNLPDVSAMFSAELMADADGIHFTLTLTNESSAGDLTTSGDPTNIAFSPGTFAVHMGSNVLFTEGEAASAGLERLAEEGNPAPLYTMELMPHSGILTPISPGVWVVHASGGLFTEGEPDPGLGLERIAEEGNPMELFESVGDLDFVESSGVFNTPDGADDPGPATPGNSYSFEISALPGDHLSFAMMFGQSNDLFFAPAPSGIPLFDGDEPVDGDVSDMVTLWDAGTEVNEPPGLGPNQAPRQSEADMGEEEDGDVMMVDDGYSYASPTTLLRVTITPR